MISLHYYRCDVFQVRDLFVKNSLGSMYFDCSTGVVDLQGWLIYPFQLIHLFIIGSLQRYEIVNGVVEVEGVANEAAADKEEDKAAEGTSQKLKPIIYRQPSFLELDV